MGMVRLLEGDELIQEQIENGDYIRLQNKKEFFWVIVAKVKSQFHFDGIVTSQLKYSSYSLGDLISFRHHNIQKIIKYFLV